MAKKEKTNASRILDKEKIDYELLSYDSSDGKIDGLSVCQKTGQDPKNVYKTLVMRGKTKEIYVAVIPVVKEVDLKKLAQTLGEKSVEPVHVKELLGLTGYIRGGCSPIGMKKAYKTVFEKSIEEIDYVLVSAGRIGLQLKVKAKDLIEYLGAETKDIVKEI